MVVVLVMIDGNGVDAGLGQGEAGLCGRRPQRDALAGEISVAGQEAFRLRTIDRDGDVAGDLPGAGDGDMQARAGRRIGGGAGGDAGAILGAV